MPAGQPVRAGGAESCAACPAVAAVAAASVKARALPCAARWPAPTDGGFTARLSAAGRQVAVKSIPKVLACPAASERKKAEQIPYLKREVGGCCCCLRATREAWGLPGSGAGAPALLACGAAPLCVLVRHPRLQVEALLALHAAALPCRWLASARRACLLPPRPQVEVLLALRGTLNVANLEAVYEDDRDVHLVGACLISSLAAG